MKYRNIGVTRVLGYAPGEEFEADLEPAQEYRLLIGGHIDYVHEDPEEAALDPDDVDLGPAEMPLPKEG